MILACPNITYCLSCESYKMEDSISLRNETNPSNYGERITVLSIDGGGIRGIIPGTILSFLESKLQVGTHIYRNINAGFIFIIYFITLSS